MSSEQIIRSLLLQENWFWNGLKGPEEMWRKRNSKWTSLNAAYLRLLEDKSKNKRTKKETGEAMSMVLAKVESSNIESIGYDTTHFLLAVKFKGSDDLYFYFGVPEKISISFTDAISKGSYFSQNIKDKYEFTKVKVLY